MKYTFMGYAMNVEKKKSPEILVFDTYGEDYDRWFDEKGKVVFQNEVQLFKSIEHYHRHPSIEIGSGSGRFTRALSIDFALEPSFKLREISIKNGVVPIKGRGEDVPFDDEVFKTVFIIVTLCFAKKPIDILREAARILHKKGHLILGLVLSDSPLGKLYIEKKQKGHKFYSVAKFYTLSEIESMLQHVGLRVYDIYSTLFSSPSHLTDIEEPVHGYIKKAGFVATIAKKVR